MRTYIRIVSCWCYCLLTACVLTENQHLQVSTKMSEFLLSVVASIIKEFIIKLFNKTEEHGGLSLFEKVVCHYTKEISFVIKFTVFTGSSFLVTYK